MNEKKTDQMDALVKLAFAKDLYRSLAGLLVTAEEDDEDGNPIMGRPVMVSPALSEGAKKELGEEAAEQLRQDIFRILENAGKEVVELICAAATGGKGIVEEYKREEE